MEREDELISKKELLELYGISYGALYRWKRKGLIPESWFIKKSTVTGQETFFPRNLICERMELIRRQKDDVSLEELSKQFSAETKKRAAVIIDTVLGKTTLYLDDIKSIVVDDGEGNQTDITNDILGGKKT
jgi:DNA-binding transcriptional MerR regulator